MKRRERMKRIPFRGIFRNMSFFSGNESIYHVVV